MHCTTDAAFCQEFMFSALRKRSVLSCYFRDEAYIVPECLIYKREKICQKDFE